MKQMIVADGLAIRSEPERIVDMRIVPWDVAGRVNGGLEMVERGALEGIDPAKVMLRQDHQDPPAGRGLTLEDRDDGAYMSFRVAKTPRGDELLANVAEGMHQFASIGFLPVEGGSKRKSLKGEPVTIHTRIDLREASTTWRPVYEGAEILAVRHEDLADMTDTAPEIVATPTPEVDRLMARVDELEERARKDVALPIGHAPIKAAVHRGQWAQFALRALAGDRVDPLELRALADVVTADNLPLVPEQYRTELLDGEISKARPFLQSTRQVPAGDSGMTINIPRLTQRPLVGIQAAEKDELASRKTIIGTVAFEAVTKGGAGDLSLQLLKRSSPSFLALWLDLLAEAYAIDSDDEAVEALLAEATVVEGGAFDATSPSFGGAFLNAIAAGRTLIPDRVWLSTAAVAAFIDAKSPEGGGGVPLYPGLAQIVSVTDGGQGGPIPLRLTPVHVPALDATAVDILVGPSKGFLWAEDGTYTLQADVPSKAGRDVGLVGILWFMPVYPAAFTSYTLAP